LAGDATGGDGRLHVYFFDVGQGDSALVVSPTGRSVLIDAGPASAGSHLAQRLPGILKGPIDLMVLSHPHADHLGGFTQALRSTGARRFLDSGLPCNDAPCPILFAALKGAGIPVVLAAPEAAAPGEPVHIGLGGGAELTVFWPRAPIEALLAGGDAEANSLVLRVEFGETSVLFTGDAQAETEEYLLRKRLDFRSTLLKVGAHGVERSTSQPFLDAVRPLAAVISAGPGNLLGAPAKPTLARLEQRGTRVFRTDLDGEVDAVSDGTHFLITTERPAAGEEPGTAHAFPSLAAAAAPGPARPMAAAEPPKTKDSTPSGAFGHVIDLDGKPTGPDSARPVASPKPDSPKPRPPATGPVRYVASRGGKVFHMLDCAAAKRIAPQNLVGYRSRADAAKDKRAAEDCNP
jgi:beta-lactamase superfamily II metal-dependent hydrolase